MSNQETEKEKQKRLEEIRNMAKNRATAEDMKTNDPWKNEANKNK
jgi:hypothetical protein